MTTLEAALAFFKAYEAWIYVLLGFGALFYVRRFFESWKDLKSAMFGLEREGAQTRLNRAATVLILLVLLAVGEFVVVSFVVPLYPEASPLLTPTLNLLATPTDALEITGDAESTPDPAIPTRTPLPTIDVNTGACVPGQIEITSPGSGDWVIGNLQILGSATAVNFGFYKLEFAALSNAEWTAISAGRVPVINGVLVQSWDTTGLPNADYVLRLVVEDNQNTALPDCRILIRVNNP